MNKAARWVGVGIVGALAIGSGGWAVMQQRSTKPPPAAAPAEVALEFAPREVTRPVMAAMPQSLRFSGALTAPRTAVVRAKAAGTLLALSVDEGSRVRAGQSLGRLDLADLATRVEERGAAVDGARARLVEAERQHAANEGLARQQFISAAALESSHATLEAARATLRAAEATRAASHLSMANAALVAPFGGIVGRRTAQPGERLAAEQEVLTVVDLSLLELAGNVATHEVGLLRIGDAVGVDVEGVPGRVSGRIDRIAPMADTGTRSIRVVVRIDNPAERLRAGLYATATVTVGDDTPRLTLPASALAGSPGQQQVWVIDGGVLRPRPVTLGRRDRLADRVEVVDGLGADAVVLAARFDNLRDGRAARVTAPAAAPAAAAPSTVAAASAPAAR